MSSETTSVLPPYIGEGRFSVIDQDHEAGSTWILAILCLTYSTLVLILRIHLRWGMFGLDDLLSAGATLVQTGQVVALMLGLKFGLGTNYALLSDDMLVKVNKSAFSAIVLFIGSMCLAKCSVVFLMMKLFNLQGPRANNNRPSNMNRNFCFGALILVILWAIGSIVALCVNCNVSTFSNTASDYAQCPSQTVRWQFITALDVATEVILVLLTVMIVYPVQISLSMKVPVVMAFSFRLICAVLSLLHFHYIHNYVYNNKTGLQIVPLMNLLQVELCWSIISATIPNLKAFIKSFNTGFGLEMDLEAMTNKYGSGRAYARQGSDYELSRVKSRPSRSENRSHIGRDEQDGSRTGSRASNLATHQQDIGERRTHQNNPSVSAQEAEDGSLASIGSQDHIIRKDIQWQVSYEETKGRSR